MVKKSLIWLYSATTWLLWMVVIVVASIVLGLRFFVLPNIQQYKDDIAQHISAAAGQKIAIGDIRASWDGLHPHLDLRQVVLHDAHDRPALTLDHVETSLSWLSLALAEPRLSSLVIHQPQLTVRREADGTVYVAGISMSGPARPEFPNWLLRQSSIVIFDASVLWQDDLRRAPPLALHKLDLHLANPPWERLIGRHRFGLRATPSIGAAKPIVIRGNLLGKDVSHPERWRGTVYARLEGTDIAVWKQWVSYPFDLHQGTGAAQAWLDFSNGRADKLVADVVLSNVVTRLGAKAPETALRNLSGRLTWSRLADGQELRAERLRLAAAGLQMQDGNLRVRNRQVNGQPRVEGSIQLADIGLEQLAGFAAHLPISAETLQTLMEIAPKGRLQQFALDWSGTPTAIQNFSLNTRFSNLAMTAYRNLPGFSGLSGNLEADQAGGKLNLNSVQAQLDLKGILRQPIPADKLSGLATWKKRDGQLEVKLTNFAIASPHISGNFSASYQHAGKGRGIIDLTGKFGRADSRYAPFYYPLVLSQSTLHWLDTSILGGRGENVNVIVKGDLDDFPWDKSSKGLFQISADISDGTLDYATGWPKIEGVKLGLLFRGNRMELNATQGRLFGNRISKAKVVIPVLDAEHPVLEITGEVQSPAQELVRFVNNSPVLDYIDRFTEHVQASGTGKLLLGMRIPLDTDGVGSKVKGSYALVNGSLGTGTDMPQLEQINGRLDFTESGILADNVRAQVQGNPLQFSLQNNAAGQLRVTAQGRIDDDGLRRLSSHPLLKKVHGSTFWTADIQLLKDSASVLVKSPLTGMALALPPPFGKSPEKTVALQVELKPQTGGQKLIGIGYGNLAGALLLRAPRNGRMQIERGEISLGDNTAKLPEQPGIALRGRLDYLDWEQWQGLSETSGGGSSGDDTGIASADLSIGALDAFGRRISDLKLRARANSNGWVANLASREITGDATWAREGNGKVVARLKSLLTPPPAPAKLSEAAPSAGRPQQYPELDVVAEDFEYKQKKLGRLELLASEQGANWKIDRLLLSNPDSTLSVDGEWRNWRQRPNTRVNLHWDVKDVGKTLDRYGYADIIQRGEANLRGQLQWPGSPHEFTVTSLDGNLKLDASDGQFLKIKPGVGRLFSLVSLQSLPRRLLLDFRDVFSTGFGFNKISGDVRIDNGVMKTDNFVMEGAPATVAIRGETDLQRETQNLHIKVTPSLSDSLSLAALAGGPAVGAAAYIAQKVLKDPLSKIVSYEYDITGTWDDPQEGKASKEKAGSATTPFPVGK